MAFAEGFTLAIGNYILSDGLTVAHSTQTITAGEMEQHLWAKRMTLPKFSGAKNLLLKHP
jgi:hypothetical protein